MKAAEQGRSSAQFYVGYYYASGYGVKKDEKLAFEWYTKATEQKNPAALNNLAICYEYGRGVEINLTKAVCYYEESAKLGNVTAQKNLANCYRNGTGVMPDSNKVFYWTLKAATNGDVESQGKIALYLLKGYGTDTNKEEALLWYARYYSKDIHINSTSEAFDFLKKNADEGDSQALYIVGKCLQYGVIVDKNYENAFKCFEKAAEFGHMESMIKVHRISSLHEFCSIKEDKNVYKDAYRVNYSEDKKVLIDSVYLKGNKYHISRGTRIICDNALDSGDVGKIIIPSSVVAIGNNPFAKPGWGRCSVNTIECYSDLFVVSDFALYTKDKKKLISYFGKAPIVTIPEGVEIIGNEAFVENEDLKEIKFPNSLCSIEDAAFKYCLNLRSISLPDNVKTIGKECFYGCESLEVISSLGEIEIISKEAFCGCNIQKVILPKSLKEIDDNAFNSNNNLYGISLPENMRRIGNSCFAFCSINQVCLNDCLLEIGDFCFFGCPIESIALPSSIESIGNNPFIGTMAIECKDGCIYASENGLLYNKQSGDLISHFSETEVALYPPITQVNSYAFYNSEVTDIFMGDNIIKIEPYAFYNARKLEKMIWKRSRIIEIPLGCFGDCSSLQTLDIPESVERIQEGSLFHCTNLKSIVFHKYITIASTDAFITNKPTDLPTDYESPTIMAERITRLEPYKREDIDINKFEKIDIIVPAGCSSNYSFSAIFDSWSGNNYDDDGYYNMDRTFVIKES